MTVEDIKKCVCKWITDAGEYAVRVPDNGAAHHGKYFAVGVVNVTQYGSLTKALPAQEVNGHMSEDMFRVAQYVATVTIHEVAGDGEKLRKFRNDFQGEAFLEFVRSRFAENDGLGLDRAFSVWDIGDIADETINDSDFFIQQYLLTFRVQFNDFVGNNRGRIKSVSGTLGSEQFAIERS